MKFTIAIFISATLLGACSSHRKPEPSREELTQVLKKQKAETVATTMLAAMDNRDWKEFENSFASRSVVFIGEPLLLKPNEITARIKPMTEYFQATKQELSDFKITERERYEQ